MAIDLSFAPCAARAAELDARMHTELAGSMRYLSRESIEAVPHDLSGIERVARRIERGGRVAPLTFADYYDCGSALFDSDDAAAAAAFARFAAAAKRAPGIEIRPLRDASDRKDSCRLIAMLQPEDDRLQLVLPAAASTAGFGARVQAGLAVLDRAVPELANEIRALVSEVVPVACDRSRAMVMDGGSHYRLWGALFLNVEFHNTPLAMAEVLAHESAHSLLFGFCTHEPLTLNDDDARFKSPLRPDPRPMDGIYHATFVSARMHLAMCAILEAGMLDTAGTAHAIVARDADQRNFEAGYAVVRDHGELTALGRALMDGAHDYMTRAAAVRTHRSASIQPRAQAG